MPTLADLVKNINPPVEITQAEYNALPEEQRQDGTEYYITDGSSSFQIAATTPAEASDGTGSNVQVELDKRLETSKIMNGPATDSGYALDARYANSLIIINQYTASYSIAANASLAIKASDFGISAISGYTPIGFADMTTGNNNVMIRGLYSATSGNVLIVRNIGSSEQTSNASIKMVFIKNSVIG